MAAALTLRAAAGALLALALSSAGCLRRMTPAEAGLASQTLLMGNAAEPADLDPDIVDSWSDSDVDYALFEALTWIDERTSRAIPAAARSWEVSADGLVYTFHLRPDGRWSNGDPVTAEDFAYAFRRILSPGLGALYSYMLWPIRNAEAYNAGRITDFSAVGVKALDPLTLRITLSRPTPYLPALAAHTTWLPVHRATVERFGRIDQRGTAWTRPGNLVGNGPFVLTQWIPNGRIVVRKNPYYWNAAHVRLNRIEFFPIESADEEELAYQAGQLQVTYSLPFPSIVRWKRRHPEELRDDPQLSSFYLFVNVRRPPLDNPKVRRALSLAIDRDAICRDVFAGMEAPAHAFTPPNCGGYTPRAYVPDDFPQARRLLAEAGYPGGRGLPVFNVLSYDKADSVQVLEAIQAGWERHLGVHITISRQEFKTLLQNQQDGNYTIAFSAWIADYPDPNTFLGMMVTGGGNNWADWSDPAYDRLIDDASRTADQARRFADFQQAESILLASAPVIPIYYNRQVYLKQPYLRGWYPSEINFHRFADVWLQR